MTNSKAARRVGLILIVLTALFLILDGASHVAKPRPVVEAFAQLGFPLSTAVTLGIIELACVVLYVVPRTSVFGAILLTGYLGGATAAKVRLEDQSLWFSVFIGVLVWAGLYLLNPRVRSLIPLVGDLKAS